MTSGVGWRRCPFPASLGLYLGLILLADCLMLALPKSAGAGFWPIGALLATLAVAGIVEVRRRKPNECPWLDFGDARRAILFLLLFVIGVVVVAPGVYPGAAVEWPLRVTFVLLAISVGALLRIHVTVDHGELEETGVKRSLYVASRIPVYVLATIAAFLVLASVLAFLGVGR